MPTIDDRLQRAVTYLEPALFDVASKEVGSTLSVSSWLRKLVIEELRRRDKLSLDLLVKLASK